MTNHHILLVSCLFVILNLLVFVESLSPVDQVQGTQASKDIIIGRRYFSFSAAGLVSLLTLSPPQPVLASTISEECQNGALVAESAVPGAYDQICMNLPYRTIPVSTIPNSYYYNNPKVLEIQQEGVGPGKTGLAVWNSGLLLARLLQAIVQVNPTYLSQLQVCELGCGAGLVSLLCTYWGASSVWATDGNPAAVALTRTNFQRNHVDYSTTSTATAVSSTSSSNHTNIVTELQWGELQVPLEWMGKVDLLVGSDLTYNSGSWRVLAETMENLLSPTGIVVYLSLGHAGFNVRGEMEGFINVAKQVGLQPSTNNLPFDLPKGISSLDMLLQSVVQPSEQAILAATGGAQVIVLSRKR